MKKLIGALFSIALALAVALPAGGDIGRQARLCPLSPTRCCSIRYNDANVDIWI
jgi:hypothetical protein